MLDEPPRKRLPHCLGCRRGSSVALFREEEDAAGYFELMLEISRLHGLPQAVYSDRHTIFQSPKKATIQQKLAGERPRSQFGRLMDELAIELIEAQSPQAKGRIERLFETFQDRLVKELRKANARTLEEANQALISYLTKFNARFGVAPACEGSAYRPWPADVTRDQVFCFKHQRTVNNDNTISFDGNHLQIPRVRIALRACPVRVMRMGGAARGLLREPRATEMKPLGGWEPVAGDSEVYPHVAIAFNVYLWYKLH